MALSEAALKDLLAQIPEFDESELPSVEDRKAYVAAQLDATEKMIYRSLVEIEVAKEFAGHKEDAYQENAKAKLEEAAATLKAYKPTHAILTTIAQQLS